MASPSVPPSPGKPGSKKQSQQEQAEVDPSGGSVSTQGCGLGRHRVLTHPEHSSQPRPPSPISLTHETLTEHSFISSVRG